MPAGTCTICLNRDGFECVVEAFGSYDANLYNCDVCGNFLASRTAIVDTLREDSLQMSPMRRATLSHYISIRGSGLNAQEMWTTDRLEQFFASNPRLPSAAQQAINIVRHIGDAVSETGEPIAILPANFTSKIGAPNRTFAVNILSELKDRGLLNALILPTYDTAHVQEVSLTLSGWEVFEQEKKGEIAGSYGFVALKFGDPVLDPLLQDHIKPAVRDIGYELVDLRDVARAGVIDNLLRMQIRDAAFVLVDLTHENAGAYWEAGYAEGLGKPVLYLCERAKFDEKKTHFDTNHCTTVLWDVSDTISFKAELTATIRRSLLS